LRSIERHVKAREGGQGWSDVEHILTLVMLNFGIWRSFIIGIRRG